MIDDRTAEEEEERGAEAPVTKAGDVMGLVERMGNAKSSTVAGVRAPVREQLGSKLANISSPMIFISEMRSVIV